LQTVNTKSITGVRGKANSSQRLLRRLSVLWWLRCSSSSARGLTVPTALLPALKARKRPADYALRMASAKMLRAELPVHRKSTL
jgi:hypothetical protein